MAESFEEAGCRICRQKARTGVQAGMLSLETPLSFQENICSGSGSGVLVSICTPNTH